MQPAEQEKWDFHRLSGIGHLRLFSSRMAASMTFARAYTFVEWNSCPRWFTPFAGLQDASRAGRIADKAADLTFTALFFLPRSVPSSILAFLCTPQENAAH